MTSEGIRVGLRGASVGRVGATGEVRLDARRAPIDWWVAADDRWHDPRQSPSVRQRRIEGVPVVETKLAVPGGDVVQTVYAVADQGGCLVVHVANKSPAAVAIAVPADGVATTASTSGTKPQGIDLPEDVRAYPLAHAGSITFAWSLARSRRGRSHGIDASTLASAEQVVRGWINACEKASRIPDAGDQLTTHRCELLLAEPRDLDELLRREPALGILAVGERVRTGDPASPWVEQLADSVRRVARRPEDSLWSSRAVSVAAHVLAQAGEQEATNDVVELWRGALESTRPAERQSARLASRLAESTVAAAAAEDRLARPAGPGLLHLFPTGVRPWLGSNVEAHGVHAGPRHRVSFAVRWHGENAALLWEVDGPPGLRLLAPSVDPGFDTSAAVGETLLRVTR